MSNTHGEWLDRIRGHKREEKRMGRLIDVDVLWEELGIIYEHQNGNVSWNDAILEIKKAPTIEERKKGTWIHVTGYCTPGGDPVWACSECGKGEHVYGIEYQTYSHNVSDGQWVACPNCGARMEVDT